jgi:predicted nucleic acid-binding protein
MAELHQGVAMARTAIARAARTEMLGAAIADFAPLPFDAAAGTRYGSLVAMTIATQRDPKPRRTDLMIAAIASSRDLPLYTRNPKDFAGLDDLVTIIAV